MDQVKVNDRLLYAVDKLRAWDDNLHRAVGELRREGATWSQIGSALGTSRQAAEQRFRG